MLEEIKRITLFQMAILKRIIVLAYMLTLSN